MLAFNPECGTCLVKHFFFIIEIYFEIVGVSFVYINIMPYKECKIQTRLNVVLMYLIFAAPNESDT